MSASAMQGGHSNYDNY